MESHHPNKAVNPPLPHITPHTPPYPSLKCLRLASSTFMESSSIMPVNLPPFPIADTFQKARDVIIAWDGHNLDQAIINNWWTLSICLIQAIAIPIQNVDLANLDAYQAINHVTSTAKQLILGSLDLLSMPRSLRPYRSSSSL